LKIRGKRGETGFFFFSLFRRSRRGGWPRSGKGEEILRRDLSIRGEGDLAPKKKKIGAVDDRSMSSKKGGKKERSAPGEKKKGGGTLHLPAIPKFLFEEGTSHEKKGVEQGGASAEAMKGREEKDPFNLFGRIKTCLEKKKKPNPSYA